MLSVIRSWEAPVSSLMSLESCAEGVAMRGIGLSGEGVIAVTKELSPERSEVARERSKPEMSGSLSLGM